MPPTHSLRLFKKFNENLVKGETNIESDIVSCESIDLTNLWI